MFELGNVHVILYRIASIRARGDPIIARMRWMKVKANICTATAFALTRTGSINWTSGKSAMCDICHCLRSPTHLAMPAVLTRRDGSANKCLSCLLAMKMFTRQAEALDVNTRPCIYQCQARIHNRRKIRRIEV